MLNPTSYTKQPWEEETIKIDFTNRLAAGDSLVSATVTMWDGTIETTANMIGNSSFSTSYVYIKIKDGIDGKGYDLRVQAITANGEKLEEDLLVKVKEES